MGQFRLDITAAVDKIHCITVMGIDARGDGEDIRVKDDVLRRKVQPLPQQPVTALADRLAPLQRVRLPLLIESHHHHSRAVTPAQPGLGEKLLFPLLQADGVHHALALGPFQPGLNHLPLGGVDHQRHPADFRLPREQFQEPFHGRNRVQHPLVHVDIDDLRAGLHLLPRHLQRAAVVLGPDKPGELRRAGHISALAHIDEQRVRVDIQSLQAAQPAGRLQYRRHPRR